MKRTVLVAVVGAALLAPFLRAAPPQESPNPRLRANKSGPPSSVEPAAKARDKYQFYTIDVEGGQNLCIYGINNERRAGGEYLDAEWGTGNSYSFLWRNGRREPLEYQDLPIIDLEKVNDRGRICGGVGFVDAIHAAVFDSARGIWSLLPDVEGKQVNFCMKMNDAGIAVGQACEGDYWTQWNLGKCVPWTWDGKDYSYPNLPGTNYPYTGPLAINNRGQIVGEYVDSAGLHHSYLQEGSKMAILEVPGASETLADDINDSGEVILFALFGDSPDQGYIWRKGVFTPLPNAPGAVDTYFHGNNDHGDFCGCWLDAAGALHGFVALRK
jgi:uncharacterized membrane protein